MLDSAIFTRIFLFVGLVGINLFDGPNIMKEHTEITMNCAITIYLSILILECIFTNGNLIIVFIASNNGIFIFPSYLLNCKAKFKCTFKLIKSEKNSF